MASEWELGKVADDEGNDVVVYRDTDGSVVLWEPDNGHTLTFPPAGRDQLRELLDRAAMPGQAGAGRQAEPVIPAAPEGCDSLKFGGGPPSMVDGHCRCIVCPHCGHHTGNSHQGHYWAWCKVARSMREFHFCCPDEAGGCELEAGRQAEQRPAT